jgi:hypothetical protein
LNNKKCFFKIGKAGFVMCAVLLTLTSGLVAKASTIISNSPNGDDGFYIGTDSPGNYAGAAVAFTPLEDYTLTNASVELSGYDGTDGQLASLSIFSDMSEPYNPDMPHQPSEQLASGTVAPNDGSQASFTVDFSGELNLTANTTYWLFVQDTSPNGWQGINGFTWVGGGDPTGDAAYNGSVAFVVSGFEPSSDPPVFSIDATSTNAPNGFISGAAMLSISYSDDNMIISWPNTGSYTLQQNNDLTTTNWTTCSYAITNDSGTNFCTITSPTDNMFFRLSNP